MSQTQKKNSSSEQFQLVLASESPRRKDLLLKAGFSFHVFSVKVSEKLEKNLTSKLNLDEQILEIARRKAVASLISYKPLKDMKFLILAADTMVILDREPLGKPENESEAFRFLSALSGREHEVKTSVVLVEGPASQDLTEALSKNLTGPLSEISHDGLKMRHSLETTKVIFKHLSERDIREYIQTGEPMDKAGAYGIQGLGGSFVEKFIGPYDNVVGLPLDLVKKLISDGGWNLR